MKYEINSYSRGHFKRLVGNLMQTIELLGLHPVQEKALKDSVRNRVWQMWDMEAIFSEEREIENPTAVIESSNTDESSN